MDGRALLFILGVIVIVSGITYILLEPIIYSSIQWTSYLDILPYSFAIACVVVPFFSALILTALQMMNH